MWSRAHAADAKLTLRVLAKAHEVDLHAATSCGLGAHDLHLIEARAQLSAKPVEVAAHEELRVAAFPGEGKHTVAIFSVPTGRWDELRASIADSLDSYRVENASNQPPPRRWALAFASLIAALLVVSVGLWRRRRASRVEVEPRAE